MPEHSTPLASVFSGWDRHNPSLVSAVGPLTKAQLAFRPNPNLRSAGEIAAHISLGRIDWFKRMDPPLSRELAAKAPAERSKSLTEHAPSLVEWLNSSWSMIASTLDQWTVSSLAKTYPQPFQGKTYAASYQWTIWRVMAHDIHHGGELAVTLGIQGISIPELGDLGGHITLPPLANAPL